MNKEPCEYCDGNEEYLVSDVHLDSEKNEIGKVNVFIGKEDNEYSINVEHDGYEYGTFEYTLINYCPKCGRSLCGLKSWDENEKLIVTNFLLEKIAEMDSVCGFLPENNPGRNQADAMRTAYEGVCKFISSLSADQLKGGEKE